MAEIQRYASRGGGHDPDSMGRWVTFEDHTAALAEVEAERDELGEAADQSVTETEPAGEDR